MALKAIIDSTDGLSEELKAHYRPGTADEGAEGKFVLDATPVDGFALENVQGLKTTFGKEMTERKRLERELKRFEGIDPDKAKDALGKVEEWGNLDPKNEADKIANSKFEAAKAQLLLVHQQEVDKRDQRINHLLGSVDNALRRQEATAAIAEAKGSVELLLPHVLSHTRLVEADGKFKIEVVDADGNVQIADGRATPMDLKGLVAQMRASDTFSRAFDGEGHSGSGKEHDSGGGHRATQGNPGGTQEERKAYFASKHPELAKAS